MVLANPTLYPSDLYNLKDANADTKHTCNISCQIFPSCSEPPHRSCQTFLSFPFCRASPQNVDEGPDKICCQVFNSFDFECNQYLRIKEEWLLLKDLLPKQHHPPDHGLIMVCSQHQIARASIFVGCDRHIDACGAGDKVASTTGLCKDMSVYVCVCVYVYACASVFVCAPFTIRPTNQASSKPSVVRPCVCIFVLMNTLL